MNLSNPNSQYNQIEASTSSHSHKYIQSIIITLRYGKQIDSHVIDPECNHEYPEKENSPGDEEKLQRKKVHLSLINLHPQVQSKTIVDTF